MIWKKYGNLHDCKYSEQNTVNQIESSSKLPQYTVHNGTKKNATLPGSVFNKSYLTNRHGRYKGYPLRSFDYGGFTDGFSDHFPVFVYLIKEVKAEDTKTEN